jgi:hypothetical protein
MTDQPAMHELVEAVRNFLETKAMPELKGHTAFHARVAANALGIVARELERGATSGNAELQRLKSLLNRDGSLEELNRELCNQIRSDNLNIASRALEEHLELTTLDKVSIDQPNYSGLKIAQSRQEKA